jgi:hypothetical protein
MVLNSNTLVSLATFVKNNISGRQDASSCLLDKDMCLPVWCESKVGVLD